MPAWAALLQAEPLEQLVNHMEQQRTCNPCPNCPPPPPCVFPLPPAGEVTLGKLIRAIDLQQQNTKTCDKDPPIYGCGLANCVRSTLHNVPLVIAVQLAWPAQVTPDDIETNLRLIDPVLHPAEIFPAGEVPASLGSYSAQVSITYLCAGSSAGPVLLIGF